MSASSFVVQFLKHMQPTSMAVDLFFAVELNVDCMAAGAFILHSYVHS